MRGDKRFVAAGAMLAALLLFAGSAAADNRLVGESGYGVHENTMEAKNGKYYSAGMDLVYAQIASGSAAGKTRAFLKCEDGKWGTSQYAIQVNMYDYRGNFVMSLVDGVNPYPNPETKRIYASALKVQPLPDEDGNRVIWFAMTGSGAGDWYTVAVAPDFDSVVVPPQPQFSLPGNWDIAWNPVDGRPFFTGKETASWTDPNAIWIQTLGGSKQKVVDIGGYGTGLAFDPAGNLYTGTYTETGPITQQHVWMYTQAQVAAAIAGNYVLTGPSGAYPPTNVISIPANENGVYLGLNYLVSDPEGNIYLTANGSFDPAYESDVGYVFRIDAWDPSNPPTTMTRIAASNKDKILPDWQKALVFDGSSSLAAGGHYNPTNPSQMGNRLYVDQHFKSGTGGPDVVSGLSTDTDTDNDGVPDALDNAYLTANAGQQDTDRDMYGNIADGDFDNDGNVGVNDYNYFRSKWLGSDPDADMDSNGDVGLNDLNLFKGRWMKSAPYF